MDDDPSPVAVLLLKLPELTEFIPFFGFAKPVIVVLEPSPASFKYSAKRSDDGPRLSSDNLFADVFAASLECLFSAILSYADCYYLTVPCSYLCVANFRR